MKKNGFTLVELLAVIAIIAILAVTAVAGYNGMTKRSKEKAYQAKVQLIETSAIKWAKENNINSKTSISVNKLIVQGYLQADSVSDEGIAVIVDPRDGSNLICKLINISESNGEHEAELQENSNNCDLAYQEVDASKIDIKAYIPDATSPLGYEGSTNKLNWTNKDVGIIVSSTDYTNVKSLTYSYGGSSITKNVVKRADGTEVKASNYNTITDETYNGFKIPNVSVISDSELTVTYTLSDGTTKSRTVVVRIDKEEPTATISASQDWMTTTKSIKIYIDDGNGSGAAGYYISQSETRDNNDFKSYSATSDGYEIIKDNLSVGTYYIFPVDKAGNIAVTYKAMIIINNIDSTEPSCTISYDGVKGSYDWYKSYVTPKMTTSVAGLSGLYYGFNDTNTEAYENKILIEGESKVMSLAEYKSETVGKNYYCFVKTAAGLSSKSQSTVKVDVTSPTLTLSETKNTTLAKTHTVTVTIQDKMSGLPKTNNIKYAWSTSKTVAPTEWKTLTITGTDLVSNRGTTSALSKDIVGSGITGTYYLWIQAGAFSDVAGNKYREGDSDDGYGSGDYIVGPFSFDNTPPNVQIVNFCKWKDNDTEPSSCSGLSTYTPGNWSTLKILSGASGSIDNDGGVGGVYYQYTTTGTTTNNTNKKASIRNIKSDGDSTIKWRACDSLGNCSDYTNEYTIKIDKVSPTVPTSVIRKDNSSGSVVSNSSVWTNETRWWGEFSSTDTVSGVNHYEYSTNCTGSRTNDLKSSYTYSSNVDYKFCIRAIDNAGNASNWSSAYYFKIDKTKPSTPTVGLYKWADNSTEPTSSSGLTAYTNNTWSNLKVATFASDSTDTGGSGLKEYQYTTTGRTSNKTNQKATQRSIAALGISYIKWRACDNAGNCSDWSTNYTVKIDTKKPSVPTSVIRKNNSSGTKVSNSSAWTNENRWWGEFSSTDVSVNSSNVTVESSGVARYEYSSGCTGNKSGNLNSSYTYTGNKNYEFCIRAVDNAGNASNWSSSYYFKIDQTVPSCTIKKTTTGETAGVDYTVTCKDSGGSGVSKCAGNTTKTSVSKTDRTTDVKHYVYDAAGNVNTCSMTVTSQLQKKTCSTYSSCTSSSCGYATCTSGSWCGWNRECVTAGGSGSYCPSGYELVGSSTSSGNCCKNTSAKTCKSSCCGYAYCASSSCGCYSWGSWTNASSCTAATSVRQCRTVYN